MQGTYEFIKLYHSVFILLRPNDLKIQHHELKKFIIYILEIKNMENLNSKPRSEHRPQRTKKPPAHMRAENDWETLPKAIKSGQISVPNPAKKTTPKISSSSSKSKSRLPQSNYLPRVHTENVLPEVDADKDREESKRMKSQDFALDWLHRAADETVKSYAIGSLEKRGAHHAQEVSEESSVVKTDQGFQAGRIVFDGEDSSEVVPSLGNVVNSTVVNNYAVRGKSPTINKYFYQSNLDPPQQLNKDVFQNPQIIYDPNSSLENKNTSPEPSSRLKRKFYEEMSHTEFIDETTKRLQQRMNSYMHEMFVQDDFKTLSSYHKNLKYKASAQSIKKNADTAKLKFTLINSLEKSLPDENDLDRFEQYVNDAEQQIKANMRQ